MAVHSHSVIVGPEEDDWRRIRCGSCRAVAGTTVIVGAPGTSSTAGAAYIYTKGASGWSNTPILRLADPAATAGDEFGIAVGVSRCVCADRGRRPTGTDSGTGAAYIYVKGSSGWSKTPTATLSDPGATADDEFGESAAVAGRTVVVGAEGTNSFAGTAYIYVNGASGWPTTPTAVVSDPAATPGDYFGFSVAVTVAGPSVIVGAPRPTRTSVPPTST